MITKRSVIRILFILVGVVIYVFTLMAKRWAILFPWLPSIFGDYWIFFFVLGIVFIGLGILSRSEDG